MPTPPIIELSKDGIISFIAATDSSDEPELVRTSATWLSSMKKVRLLRYVQYNTIYYARRLILADRALVTNSYVHCLVFVFASPSPCCATRCSICVRIS